VPALDQRPARWKRKHVVAGLVVLAAVGAALVGPFLTIVLAAGLGGAVVMRRHRSLESARRAVDDAMPDAIELMVVCLHAGLTPTQAVAELARVAPLPVRPAFTAVEQRLHRGAAFAEALGELTARCGRSAVSMVAAMSGAARDGLPLAPVLDRLTDEANASRRRNGEAAARRLPVRLSFPLVTCTLPSFVLLAIAPAVLGALSTVSGATP
jgi:tight adherence protein C